ncbi:TolB family protein, partial [[Eubacterium] cellulosolvens]
MSPMYFKKYVLSIVMSISLLACVSFTLSSTQTVLATYPGGNGLIAFERNIDGNDEIYTMNPDGSDLTRLTFNPDPNGDDDDPKWSSDGFKIVWDSDRDSGTEIYIMNPDGSDVTRLTDTEGSNETPDLSPDGWKIVFESTRDGGEDEIYVMNSDGSNPTRLTDND